MKLAFVFLFLIFTLNSKAATWMDWNSEYKRLCLGLKPSKDCRKLKVHGYWLPIHLDTINKLENEFSEDILQASHLYNVSIESIVTILLVESTVDFRVSDSIQNFLVRALNNQGSFLGKEFSFGIGQMKYSKALEIENKNFPIEERDPRSKKEIIEAILDDHKVIYYIASYIEEIIKAYSHYGFDISDSPDIISTIYSIGNEEKLAQRTYSQKRNPRLNFKGIYAAKISPLIEKITLKIKSY